MTGVCKSLLEYVAEITLDWKFVYQTVNLISTKNAEIDIKSSFERQNFQSISGFYGMKSTDLDVCYNRKCLLYIRSHRGHCQNSGDP